MNKTDPKEQLKEAPKAKSDRVAMLSPELMQQLFDTIRDYVPHKPAEPILTALRKVQYVDLQIAEEKG